VTTQGRPVDGRGEPEVLTEPGRDRRDRTDGDRGRGDLVVDARRCGTDQHRREDGEHPEQNRG
jgi:hypothetical protein